MVWSRWKGSLLILAAWAGLASAQVPATPHNGCGGGDGAIYLMVAEPGKTAQKCKLLWCWQENGHTYAQVQAVDTNEMITMMDPPLPTGAPKLVTDQAPPAPKTVTKIFRWGNSPTCPTGFPQPPSEMVAKGWGGGTSVAGGSPYSGNCAPCQGGSTQIVTAEPPTICQPAPKQGLLAKIFGNNSQGGMSTVTPPVVTAPTPPVQYAKQPAAEKSSLADLASGAPAGPPSKAQTQLAMNSIQAQPAVNGGQKDSQSPIPPPAPVPYSGKDLAKPGSATANPPVKSDLPPVSKAAQSDKSDPLANFSSPIPDSAKKKLDIKPADLNPGSGKTVASAPQLPGNPAATMQKPGAVVANPAAANGGIPLGMQSVEAAYGGAKNGVKYFPYPVVTTPAPTSPPYPPPPSIPNAPQPIQYQNAFTPPQPPQGQQPGAGGPMMAGNPYMYGPPMMVPGYMGQPMMSQGYPYAPPAYQPSYPSSPSNPMGMARNYPGPLPPSPVSNPMFAQVAYQANPYMASPLPASTFANPAMDRPATTPNASADVAAEEAVYQLLLTLKTAMSPAQREWAAMGLAKYDWHNQPHLVQGLLVGAREDPAATVRVACVKGLVRLGVNKDVYASTLQSMRNDADPRVRQAVEQALAGPDGTPAIPAPSLTPVGHSAKQ